MRILKPIGEEIELDGKLYHLLFNVNVIDEIQEHYDMYIVDVLNSIFGSEDRTSQRKAYDIVVYVFATLINEDVRLHNEKFPNDKWEEVTEEYLKSQVITNGTSSVIGQLILKSFNGTLPKSEEDDPNQKSEQAKK